MPCVSGCVWMTRSHERVGYIYGHISVCACVCVWACAWEGVCECEGVCLCGSVGARVCLWEFSRTYLSGVVHSVWLHKDRRMECLVADLSLSDGMLLLTKN